MKVDGQIYFISKICLNNDRMTDSAEGKNVANPKEVNSPLLPRRKDSVRQRSFSCSFQKQEKNHRGSQESKPVDKKYSFPEVVEKVMREQKPKIHYSDFYKNARRSVAWRKRLEQPWMRGNEMQAFYKMWSISSHITPQRKLPKVVHRSESLPRNFKFPGELCLHEGKERKPQQDFGIFRDCCCAPRVRIKTFHDSH